MTTAQSGTRKVSVLCVDQTVLRSVWPALQDAALAHGCELQADSALQTLAVDDPGRHQPSRWLEALQAHAACLLTLLIVSDAHAPAGSRVDPLRAALIESGLAFCVLSGEAAQIAVAAEAALAGATRAVTRPAGPKWRWVCPDCDDGDCERHVLSALHGSSADES